MNFLSYLQHSVKCSPMFYIAGCPHYLFAWLFDLNQDGEDKEQYHHSRGHTDHCPVCLCDLVKNAFALFL